MSDATDASQDIEESRWPRSMERCPLWLGLAIGAAVPIASMGIGLARGGWKWAFFAVAVVASLASLAITLARDSRQKKLEKAVEQRRKQADDDNQSLIDGQLSPVIQLVAELIATDDEVRRRTTAGRVQIALVVAASAIVGSANVRANLFEMEASGGRWCMQSRLWYGRGRKSTREFKGDDDATMVKSLAGQYRFVERVDPGLGLEYETYLTYPITDGTTTYGVLTVDALHSGELSEARDIPIVRVLAALAAISYAAVGAVGAR